MSDGQTTGGESKQQGDSQQQQQQGDSQQQQGAAPQTFTQEQLDRIVGERLGREREKFADYDDLKAKASKLDEIEEANQTDLEKLAGERDKLKGEVEPLRSENLRLRVALEKKLPAELIDRLKGGTKEEMESDADKLLELVGGQTTTFDGGARDGAAAGSVDDLIRGAKRRRTTTT